MATPSRAAVSRPAPPETYRFLRYLAPNAVTCASLVFGMVSAISSAEGHWNFAAWMIIYAVLTDRLDGMVARMVRGTSDLGVQLDSFADFLNFGLAPAFLLYSFFHAHPRLGFADGAERVLLIVACIAWVFAAVFRLARFNVAQEEGVPTKIFFGVPTTLAGGLLIIWFLAFLKYAPEDLLDRGEHFGGSHLLGAHTTPDGVWSWFPVAMLIGAFLMASSLRMLKAGKIAGRFRSAFVLVNITIGYALGFAQLYPEWLVVMPSAWFVVFLIWGQTSEKAKAFHPPPLFPRKEGEDSVVRMRPQEDLAPEDDAV